MAFSTDLYHLPAAFERARRLESENGERIDRIAAKLGLVSERDLARLYAEVLGSPLVGAEEFPTQPMVRQARQRCWRYDWVLDIDVKAYFDSIDWGSGCSRRSGIIRTVHGCCSTSSAG